MLEHKVQTQGERHGDDEEREDEAKDDGDAGADGHVQRADRGVEAKQLYSMDLLKKVRRF